MSALRDLKVKIFADGADLSVIAVAVANPLIQGFTTNPTLMRKAGVTDYRDFARQLLCLVPDRPVSFEVFSDDFNDMERQAMEISSWGRNVYVKIPVTDTRGTFTGPLIRRLGTAGVQVNVTAVMTPAQVARVVEALAPESRSFVSVFAGRIADSGRDPVPIMVESLRLLRARPQAELIWASPREVLNVVQASSIGCHVITLTRDLLEKLPMLGKDLDEFSLDTVQMFHRDAQQARFSIETSVPQRESI